LNAACALLLVLQFVEEAEAAAEAEAVAVVEAEAVAEAESVADADAAQCLKAGRER
jgi:hypothetical protein